MNHRDLMLARDKKPQYKFLELPETVQDEIIKGLDRCELTEDTAEELARSHACEISGRAISRYYKALRRERALYLRRESLQQSISSLLSVDAGDASKMYAKLAIDIAVEAMMAAGNDPESIKNAAQAASSAIRAVADLTRARSSSQKVEAELMRLKREESRGKGEKPMSEEEMLNWIRKRVYGLGA